MSILMKADLLPEFFYKKVLLDYLVYNSFFYAPRFKVYNKFFYLNASSIMHFEFNNWRNWHILYLKIPYWEEELKNINNRLNNIDITTKDSLLEQKKCFEYYIVSCQVQGDKFNIFQDNKFHIHFMPHIKLYFRIRSFTIGMLGFYDANIDLYNINTVCNLLKGNLYILPYIQFGKKADIMLIYVMYGLLYYYRVEALYIGSKLPVFVQVSLGWLFQSKALYKIPKLLRYI